MNRTRTERGKIRDVRREKEVVGEVQVEVWPTRHFRRRFMERVGDLVPEIDPKSKFVISGILVSTYDDDLYYLDVGAAGRLVIRKTPAGFFGITVLPRIYCHGVPVSQAKGSRAGGGSRETSAPEWFNCLLATPGNWDLFNNVEIPGSPDMSSGKGKNRLRGLPLHTLRGATA